MDFEYFISLRLFYVQLEIDFLSIKNQLQRLNWRLNKNCLKENPTGNFI
jgi:hypothetical protein